MSSILRSSILFCSIFMVIYILTYFAKLPAVRQSSGKPCRPVRCKGANIINLLLISKSGLGLLRNPLRICDTRMVNLLQIGLEDILDSIQLHKGNVGILELAVGHLGLDDIFHQG